MPRLALLGLVGLCAAGCGPPAPPAADPARKITWEQFRKLSPEDQADPYVLHNLDDDARARLAAAGKNKPGR